MSNIPKLRFKEFSEKWKKRDWSKTVEISKDMVDPRSGDFDNLVHIGPGNIESFTGKLYDNILTVKDSNLISGKFHFNKGDIIYGKIRPNLAKFIIAPFEGLTSADTYVLNAKNGIVQGYLYLILQTNTFYKYSVSVSSRTGMPKINRDELNAYVYQSPQTIDEQNKIVSFLNSVDSAIEQLTQKEKLLRKYKKGLIQKIFNQELRFKDDDGMEFPEWKDTSMNKIFKERKTYSTKAEDYEHISLTKVGVIPKSKRYERDFLVSDDTIKKYKITHINDICYNPANLKFGVICRNKYGSGIFSPIYITFEVLNSNVQFIEYFVTRKDFINKVRKYEEGTVYERQSVKPSDFLKFSIAMPSLKEQTKIASFISSLDIKIEQVNKQLNLTKEFKKALLQKMFV